MDKDEMNKYKWLDAQEVRPPSFTDSGQQKKSLKKIVEFLTEE